jgi:hypothetical protein
VSVVATAGLGRAVLHRRASLRRGEVESGCVTGSASKRHGPMIKEWCEHRAGEY